ncbi:hypothetical protein YA5_013650 [Tetragenococcus halophilus]|nr:hypothetical protein YG2_13540 [Tetragenococcus halophilus]GLL51389.1 hypothetical protein YA5_013650 [Tetragenococcus halophilus]
MFEVTFQDYTFQSPLMNASGVHCMTSEELNGLVDSRGGDIYNQKRNTAEKTRESGTSIL